MNEKLKSQKIIEVLNAVYHSAGSSLQLEPNILYFMEPSAQLQYHYSGWQMTTSSVPAFSHTACEPDSHGYNLFSG